MPYGHASDASLDESTNRVMVWGGLLMVVLVGLFPLYRWTEPGNREEARQQQLRSLAQQGGELWSISCASCHGLSGEGGIAPALNSKQFLAASTDEQTELIISVGIPGSQMSAYSQDFAGPLTSEQISAITIFIRSWEENAPDRPDWRAAEG